MREFRDRQTRQGVGSGTLPGAPRPEAAQCRLALLTQAGRWEGKGRTLEGWFLLQLGREKGEEPEMLRKSPRAPHSSRP